MRTFRVWHREYSRDGSEGWTWEDVTAETKREAAVAVLGRDVPQSERLLEARVELIEGDV